MINEGVMRKGYRVARDGKKVVVLMERERGWSRGWKNLRADFSFSLIIGLHVYRKQKLDEFTGFI